MEGVLEMTIRSPPPSSQQPEQARTCLSIRSRSSGLVAQPSKVPNDPESPILAAEVELLLPYREIKWISKTQRNDLPDICLSQPMLSVGDEPG
jgi:hypothetical protein